MYSYLKCFVYDKLLKPRQSFRITLYSLAQGLYLGFYVGDEKTKSSELSGNTLTPILLVIHDTKPKNEFFFRYLSCHTIFVHVSIRKGPSSGNQTKALPHKTKLASFIHI